MLFFLVVCTSVNDEIHRLDKGVILFDIERSYEITLPRKIYYKGDTEIEVGEVSFFVEEKIDITAGVILVFGEFQCD